MKRTRKIFALLLSICMIVTMLPTVAFAALQDSEKLQVTVEETGMVTVKDNQSSPYTATGELKYAIVDGDKQTTIDEWTASTTEESAAATGISAPSNNFNKLDVNKAVLTTDDTGYIVVVDVKDGKIVAAGQAQITGVTRDIKVKDSINGITSIDGGKLSKSGYGGNNTLKYVVLSDNPTSTINGVKEGWSNETLTENNVLEAVKSLAGENTFKTLTDDVTFGYDDNNKHVLVIELKEGHVQAYKDLTISGIQNSAAKLTKVEVKGATVQPGDPGEGGTEGAPKPLTAKIPYAAPNAQPEITVTASADAIITYGSTAKEANQSYSEKISNVTVTPEVPGVVYIKVASQDTKNTVYYKLTISMESASPDAVIESITVDDNGSKVDVKNTGTTFGTMEELKSEIPYSESPATATVKVEASAGAKITYKDGPPEHADDFGIAYTDAGISVPGVTTEAEKTIYIKVTSQDEKASKFVKLTITMKTANDDASIANVKVGEYEAVLDTENAEGKDGTTNENAIPWTVTVPAGEKAKMTGKTATFKVNKLANKVEYDVSKDGSTLNKSKENSTFKETGEITTEEVNLSTDSLYIKVTAENKDAKFYKITVVDSEIAVDEVAKVEITTEDLKNADVAESEKEAVVEAVKATGIEASSKDYIKALAFETASAQDSEKWKDSDDLIATLKRDVNPDAEQAHVRVVAYLNVEVESYDEGEKTYVVDLTPKYYVAVATESAGELTFGKGGNAYKLVNDENLTVTKPVKVEVTLPESMGADSNPVWVTHNGKITKVTDVSSDKVTFDAESFSPYKFAVTDPTVATVGGVAYDSLEEAIKAVTEGNTEITLGAGAEAPLTATAPAGKTFTIKPGSTGIEVDKNVTITPEDPDNYKVVPDPQADGSVKYTIVEKTDAEKDDNEGNGEGGTNDKHTVKVADGITNGTVTVDKSENVAKDETVTVTVKPAEGYELDQLTIKTDSGAVPRDEGENGTYTFKMPEADVTVSATFKLIGTETEDTICKPYTDVDSSKDSWYHDDVHYMIENGLMTGVAADKFAPNMKLNRAMVTQILYAKANKPTDFTASKTFSDVEKDQWYTNAVLWAAEKGAVTGYEDGTFRPLRDITRQELAVMLYGIEGQPAVTDNGELKAFTDAASVADWAQNGMLWAVQSDIMDGDNNKALNPTKTATRAEAAVMLHEHFAK